MWIFSVQDVSSKRVGVVVTLMNRTGEVQLVNVALLSVRFFLFSSSVISNTLPFPSVRRMLLNMHPLVDVLRRNVEGEMRRKREGERLMFAKEIAMSDEEVLIVNKRREDFPICLDVMVDESMEFDPIPRISIARSISVVGVSSP